MERLKSRAIKHGMIVGVSILLRIMEELGYGKSLGEEAGKPMHMDSRDQGSKKRSQKVL